MMHEYHQVVWPLEKEERKMYKKSKKNMTAENRAKYTLEHIPKFTCSRGAYRGYMEHGFSKEGVKFYKHRLVLLKNMSRHAWDYLDITWGKYVVKSGFGKE